MTCQILMNIEHVSTDLEADTFEKDIPTGNFNIGELVTQDQFSDEGNISMGVKGLPS